jgi:hypothetical protein
LNIAACRAGRVCCVCVCGEKSQSSKLLFGKYVFGKIWFRNFI